MNKKILILFTLFVCFFSISYQSVKAEVSYAGFTVYEDSNKQLDSIKPPKIKKSEKIVKNNSNILPKTGDKIWFALEIIGGSIVISGLIVILKNRKKEVIMND